MCSCLSDHVLEALLNTSVDLDSLKPDSVLEDRWIKEVVTRSGMKFRWAKLSESKERENRDAVRRYVDRNVPVICNARLLTNRVQVLIPDGFKRQEVAGSCDVLQVLDVCSMWELKEIIKDN